MRIIFPQLDYSGSLFIAEADTLEGRRERLAQRFFSGLMYLMKHLIYTICSSHMSYHRTSSIDCDLHKLMNTILCELKNLKDLLSLYPLIIEGFRGHTRYVPKNEFWLEGKTSFYMLSCLYITFFIRNS